MGRGRLDVAERTRLRALYGSRTPVSEPARLQDGRDLISGVPGEEP
jgi:hypothetical protein